MTKEEIFEQHQKIEELRCQLTSKLEKANLDLAELRDAYWKLTGDIQIGDVLQQGNKKGEVFAIQHSDYDEDLTRLSPNFMVRLYKQDGTLGERVTRFYSGWGRWKKVS